MVFGYRAGSESGLHVEAKFMGPTGIGSVQIDGVKFTGCSSKEVTAERGVGCGLRGGGGMVSAKHTSAADRAAYLIPVGALLTALPQALPHLRVMAGGAAADTPSRLFQLPGLLSDFVGREKEVSELVSRLRSDGGRVGLSALKGMGGVGKTTLRSASRTR